MNVFSAAGRRDIGITLPGWSSRDLRQLLRLSEVAEYEPGDVLVAESRIAQEFLLLTAGAAQVLRGNRVLRSIGVGDHIGGSALLTGARYDATVVTDRYCRALLLGPREFISLLANAASFGRMLATSLAHEVVPAQRTPVADAAPRLTPRAAASYG